MNEREKLQEMKKQLVDYIKKNPKVPRQLPPEMVEVLDDMIVTQNIIERQESEDEEKAFWESIGIKWSNDNE